MKTKLSASLRSPLLLAICACGIVCSFTSAQAQVTQAYPATSWTNDPYSANANWGIVNAGTASPVYTNNGVSASANLFGDSHLSGGPITLTTPGQTVTLTSVIVMGGNINSAGNVQFRVGLYYSNAIASDTGWAGYMVSQPTSSGGGGLYLRNIPNTGSFGSSTGTTQPTIPSGSYSFASGWGAGTYNFTLSVTYLSSSSTLVLFAFQGVGNNYLYSVRYTNTAAATQGGFSFDTVGFLGGGSTFSSASTSDAITFSNTTVTLGNFGDGVWTDNGSGNWSTTGDWANSVPANGPGFKADFSQVALSADATATLDTSRTIGSLISGAAGGSTNNWTLANSGGSVLTLNNDVGTNAPTIAVNQNTTTLSLPLVSSNGLIKTGAGNLDLSGTNTMIGPLNLNGGELNFTTLSNLPLAPNGISTINSGGGALQWGTANTVDISALGISIPFTGTVMLDTGANNVTLADSFGDGGVGGLVKLGTGKLTMSSADIQYAGPTTVSNGTLALTVLGSISTSSGIEVMSGATLDVSAISGGFILFQSFSGPGTVLGNISDSSYAFGSGYAATGAPGTLTVNGNLTLSGGTVTFGLANVTTAGSGVNDLITVTTNLNLASPVTLNLVLINGSPGLGTYTLFNYGTFSGSAANLLPPSGFVVTNNAVAKTIGLIVTHIPANLTWDGNSGNNVWDTDTTSNWVQSGTNQFFFAGDSVTFNDSGIGGVSFPITISANNVAPASVTVSNNAVTYDFTGGEITSGQLIKTNTGILYLENSNTYSGPTIIGGGVLEVGGPFDGGTSGSLGTGPITNSAALVFNLAQNYTLSDNIFGTGSITNIGSGGTIFLSGNVSGANLIQNSASASLELTGSNNITGQILVPAGTLFADSTFSLNGSANPLVVSSGGQLYINANFNVTNKPLTLAGTGGGTGALRKGGNGVTTYGGAIKLTNSTQINVDGGSTFNLTNTTAIQATNITNVNVVLDAGSGGAGNITAELILGTGSLTAQDAGNWTIATSNSYTGLTTISGGLLIIGGTNALGPCTNYTANYVTLSGGYLAVTNNLSFSDGLRGFTASGTAGGFDVTNGMTLTIANEIVGTGTLVKSDGGTLILSGSNSFSGTLDPDSGANALNDGTFVVDSPYAITNVASPIAIRNNLGGASTFELNGGNGNIILTQNITLNGRSPSFPSIDSVSGTNTLGGSLTCGGGGANYRIECDAGLLTLGGGTNVLMFTTVDPQVFTFQGSGSITVAGPLTDPTNAGATTGVLMNGTGKLTLAAINTNTGPTTVNSGILWVTGTTGTGAVNLNGGTLGGPGTINGAVTSSGGSIIWPGSDPSPGTTLTLSSNLSIGGNVEISVNTNLAQINDKVSVAGSLNNTGTGTLTVSNSGSALVTGTRLQIFNKALTNGGTMTVTGASVPWINNLAVDGSITVGTASRPVIATTTLVGGTNLVMHATNGTPGGAYTILTSTNVAAPLSTWSVSSTGNYDGSGDFTVTNVVTNSVPKKFFVIQQP